jgi:hypothetical protein
LLTGEDLLQGPPLRLIGAVVDVQAGGEVALGKRAGGIDRHHRPAAGQIHPVACATLDVEGEHAAAPALVRARGGIEQAGAEEIAVAELVESSGQLPTHGGLPSR